MIEDHLEKLRAFYLTATEGSFLKASERLGRTQPAVTKAVKLLEADMRTTLFIRHARGVILTSAGVLLSHFCESLFLRIRDLERQIASTDRLSGTIKIGTHETLDEIFFPRFLLRLGEKFPGLMIELTTENVQSQWSKLEAGAIDMIVGLEPKDSERFYSRVLYSDNFGIFCKKGLASSIPKDRIPIAYVKRPFEILGVSIEHFLHQINPQFDLRYSVDSFITVRALALEGVCVGVMPVLYAKKFQRDRQLIKFRMKERIDNFCDYRVCATCVQDLRNEPRIVEVVKTLKAVTSSL